MFDVMSKAGERLLAVVLPKADAAAGPTVCSPGSYWWGSFCYCSGRNQYYKWCRCNGSGSSYSCYCKYRNDNCPV